jgi:hypothetical protein
MDPVPNRMLCDTNRRKGPAGRREDWRAAIGCDPKVLAKIRTDVFDISAPKQ